jgi:hypothetical protein
MEIQIKKIRKINSLILAFCVFYLIQNFTIGLLKIGFNEIIIGWFYLKEITFFITSFVICKILFD